MTNEIREKMRERIAERYPTQRQLAIELGIDTRYLSAILTGNRNNIPVVFGQLLDKLDLELCVHDRAE